MNNNNNMNKLSVDQSMESGVYSHTHQEIEDASESMDVYSMLVQKERDLVLAAELGKALLDKNEELSKQNELIAEEFSAKLEELEQEKHHLKRKLESSEEEYELRINELQNDVISLRNTLEDFANTQKQSGKDKSLVISTLTEQNQRLTNQLKETAKNEESLLTDLHTLKDQVSIKRSSLNDHVSHLDMLREEINLMTERKLELERRIDMLHDERDSLSATLDESTSRIIMLEKQSKEQGHIIRTNEKTIDELRTQNLSLTERLDGLYRSMSLSPSNECDSRTNVSILNEMETSDSDSCTARTTNHLSHLRHQDLEVDDDILLNGYNNYSSETISLKEEILSSLQQIKNLCAQLRQQQQQQKPLTSSPAKSEPPKSLEPQGSEIDPAVVAAAEATTGPISDNNLSYSSSTESVSGDVNRILAKGSLNSAVNELRGLLHDILRKSSKSGSKCSHCGVDKNKNIHLEVELHKTKEHAEKTERILKDREDELKKKDAEILELESKLSVTETKLNAAMEEVGVLKDDLSRTGAGKDELIKKAWEVRDSAVKRKNNTEIELAKTRIDVMQVNSQLLEAIRQKVELSKQLEQWQVDMEELLEEQMIRKMKATERRGLRPHDRSTGGGDSDSSTNDRRKTSKILNFFKDKF